MSYHHAMIRFAVTGAALWLALPLHAGEERTIRHSDVVFMYDNPAMYGPYGCTVMGWAGSADRQGIERAHAAGVRLFSCSVGFLTEGQGVMDFDDDFLDAAARNFAGEPFIVPWLWDHEYKGHGYYWWCTNSPLYRRYLESRLERTMAAAPTGLHIDDYRGTSGSVTWLDACYCRHCMAAFRDYLKGRVTADQLRELGIADLASFDYREYLLARGVKPEEYRSLRSGLPLASLFLDFHVTAATQFVADYHARAREVAGDPALTLCVNSGLSDPPALAIAPHVTYFCCEVPHDAASLAVAKRPIYTYKLADAVDRPVTSTASGHDWDYVKAQAKPGLVRTWVALSYAMGHNFMAPHRQWCYSEERGTDWYDGPTEEYAPIYQFVRANAGLLDGYEAIAPVAVVYDNAAARQHRGSVEELCVTLAERNVPFEILAAGDDWLPQRLSRETVNRHRVVFLSKQATLADGQSDALEDARGEGRVLAVEGPLDPLDAILGAPIQVEGATGVMVVPRARDDRSAAIVLHLLNRDYDGAADAMRPRGAFTLRINRDLLPPREFREVVLHPFLGDVASLEINQDEHELRVSVPGLDLWAILELR